MTTTASARPPSGSQTFRALRHRNARVYFAGLAVSNVGTWLQMTAMALLVYNLTGKATDLGITVALQFLPVLLFGAWGGAIADRRDKRTMAIALNIALAAQALVLGLVDLAGLATVPIVWLLTIVLGVLNAFESSPRRGLVTELVEPHDISNATSLNTAVMTGSRIFGPALAALLVATVGTSWCFLLNAASFVAVLVSLFAIRPAELHPPPLLARGGRPVREALGFVRHNEQLLLTFIVMVVVSTFAFNYPVALPELADENWGGEGRFGLVLAMGGVGSLIGALLMARLAVITMNRYLVSTAILGFGGLGLAWAPNLPMALLWAIPMGLGGGGFISGGNGIAQQLSPPDMRGRLLALTTVAFLGSTPIGGPITGVIGDSAGAEWGLGYGSIATLLTAAVATVVTVRGRARHGHRSPRSEPAEPVPGR
ncbi:MAG: MFS transporter [Ilumatobacteraceae bacterium]